MAGVSGGKGVGLADASGTMVLRLYVAGTGPNSVAARANLRQILAASQQPHSLEVVDCLEHPMRALKEGVLVTPTLIRRDVSPPVTIIGSLSDPARVCDALGIAAPARSGDATQASSEVARTT